MTFDSRKENKDNVFVFYDANEWMNCLAGVAAVSPGGICAKYGIDRGALNNLINRDGIVQAYYYIDPYRLKKFKSVGNSAFCLIPLEQFQNPTGELAEWLKRHYERLEKRERENTHA